MRKHRISTLLVALGMLTVLWSCQKQGDEPSLQPEGETVNVKFNTFLREGDNVRPLNQETRMVAAEGTLANGFYLYGHVHTQPFATSSGNTYTPIFENVKINADGTYTIPKFWLKDKLLFYSFQAYAATSEKGEVGPGTVTIESGAPYINSTSIPDAGLTTDILGAAVYDIKIGDETPTVNLYFEHRLARLSMRMQRMNAGGPTLYNLRMKIVDKSWLIWSRLIAMYWAPGKRTTADTRIYASEMLSTPITLPASDMTPIEAHSFIIPPQDLTSISMLVELSYTLEPSSSNPLTTLTTTVPFPAFRIESGKQLNVVISFIVETEQIVVNSVTLTDWVTSDKNVPEYGGYTPAGCFDIPIGGSFPNTYVALVDEVLSNWNDANANCTTWGGRLPTEPELKAMYDNKLKYGTFVNVFYWSAPGTTYPFVKNMATGEENWGSHDPLKRYGTRCVKDKK